MKALTRKDVAKLVADAGLVLASVEVPRSCHYHVRATRPDGLTAMFVLPSTPSDWRGLKNKLAELKRFARGDYTPIQQRSPK